MKTFFKLLTISFLINSGTLTAAIAHHHSAADKPENAGMLEIVATPTQIFLAWLQSRHMMMSISSSGYLANGKRR